MGEPAANAETAVSNATQAAPKGGAEPAPVPYAVFKEANDRAKALETERDTFKKELDQYGRTKFEELNTTATRERTRFSTKLELARAGVQSDSYLDYLTDRYSSLPEQGRPAVKDFIAELRTSEPAFFGAAATPSAGAATTTTTSTPTTPAAPKTNPDANAQPGNGAAGDPPITDEWLKTCSTADFERRFADVQKYLQQRKRGA
jgi:hypothetical protein